MPRLRFDLFVGYLGGYRDIYFQHTCEKSTVRHWNRQHLSVFRVIVDIFYIVVV